MSEKITRTSRFEEIKISQESISEPLPGAPLVTFDLNLNKLQEYLNKVSVLVNKNTLHIQKLSEEITQKVAFADEFEILEGLALSIPKEFGGLRPKSQTHKDGMSAAHESIQGLCEKIKELDDFKKETSKKMEKFQSLLNERLTIERFESEKKMMSEKIKKKVSKKKFVTKTVSIENQIKQAEENFNTKLNEMDKKISDFEVNTLWKIRDCENLLKTRVNEKFVWDALGTLEAKIKKENEAYLQAKKSMKSAKFEALEKEIRRIESESNSKIQESKKLISEHDVILSSKMGLDKYQELMDLFSSKSLSKLDFIELKLKEHEEKLNLLALKPHHDDFTEEFYKLTTKAEYLSSEIEKKAEKEAVIELINSIKNVKAPPPQTSTQDMNEFWKFRDKSLKNFEGINEKFEKISKALDLTSIKRALALKANDDETKEEFLSLGQRLINLEKNDIDIAKEIDRINALVKKLLQMIEDLGKKSGFALISKKSWASNCLSCGRGDSAYIPTIPHVQGFDGRFYKADLTSFRPAVTGSDWKSPEDEEYPMSKSPISLAKLQKPSLGSILGKDLIKSLSSTAISPNKRFRPSSARK